VGRSVVTGGVSAARAVPGRIFTIARRLGGRRRARRVLAEERLLATDLGGWTLYYPSSSIIGRAVAGGSGWEPTLATALDLLLPRDESLLIVEVGSNIGASLAQMISVRPDARYVCFEPAERFRDVLVKNVDENGWGNVTIEESLVGSRSETVRLFTNTSTASVAKRHYGEHVFLGSSMRRVVTLDDYFNEAQRLDLIKTDTDGFDFDVLLGASAVLSRLLPALYFEFAPFLARDVGREATDILAYLGGLGYRRFLVFAQSGELLRLSDDPADVIGLADDHKYVDVLTATRPEHLAAFPDVATATTR
jgi:FkbM family methyltransferase